MASVRKGQSRKEEWRRGRKGGQGRRDGEAGSVVSRLQPCRRLYGALTIDLVASASSGRVAHAEATVRRPTPSLFNSHSSTVARVPGTSTSPSKVIGTVHIVIRISRDDTGSITEIDRSRSALAICRASTGFPTVTPPQPLARGFGHLLVRDVLLVRHFQIVFEYPPDLVLEVP